MLNEQLKILQAQLVNELETALSSIPAEIRKSNLLLQLLQIRMRNPNSWKSLVEMWYKLDADFPEIGTILSKYDVDYPEEKMHDALRACL
ncbi:MAG: hypothetical protein P1P90_02955 [Patescibacteria group bacterium]|nr:hypothetical protein [Patescibacteria group bacterium]